MAGLRTFYGNLVSAYADRRLDLVGMGRLLGLSPDPDQNALAAMRYRTEFGPGEVYSIQSSVDVEGEERRALAAGFRGQVLFGEDVSYAMLADMLREGGEVKTTLLSEEFDWNDFVRRNWKQAVPLFALTSRGSLRPFLAGEDLVPEPGWRVVSLAKPSATQDEQDSQPQKDGSNDGAPAGTAGN